MLTPWLGAGLKFHAPGWMGIIVEVLLAARQAEVAAQAGLQGQS